MQGEYQLRLQVFSNGHFQTTRRTPWEGIEETVGFKPLLPRILKGEVLTHHGRQYRAV